MIGSVLAKGGPVHISSKDDYVRKFAEHYLRTLKEVDDSIAFARSGKSPDPATTAFHVYATGKVVASQFFNRQGFSA
jgi:hypothetical protein